MIPFHNEIAYIISNKCSKTSKNVNIGIEHIVHITKQSTNKQDSFSE